MTNLMEDIMENTSVDLDEYTPTIWCKNFDSNNLLVNTGIYDNRTSIENLVAGTKYRVKLKLYAGSADITNGILRCGYYPYNASNHVYSLTSEDK